ncbi:hypothetical protein BO85DRAFT_444237 [Aspergillus piperis CBS 112811]|uniref:Uncharacterized protein n=1 Tax=Aspergillus piperis CBS 112811 TaxID=1448313 RepID=A0A8G1RC17_9EURO|nr:hypothetical protein BO85DRAFT_444237 [Aspergillus piperis CBS 112811]RAH62897.1 hypothetical protein BO85DRAFT_444237 [Aspergillus piperis CBS 112811]
MPMMNGNSDTAKAPFPILLSEMGNLTREVKALIDKDDAESGVESAIMQRNTRLFKTHCCMRGLISSTKQPYVAMRCAALRLLGGYTT